MQRLLEEEQLRKQNKTCETYIHFFVKDFLYKRHKPEMRQSLQNKVKECLSWHSVSTMSTKYDIAYKKKNNCSDRTLDG